MTVWSHLKKKTITGLLMVLPLVVTIFLLSYIFRRVDKYITPYVVKIFELFGVELISSRLTNIALGIIGFILTVFIIYLIGLFGSNIIGKRLVAAMDTIMLKLPLIKNIYGGARQLLQSLSTPKMGAFERVVLVQYPREGIYTLGFATSDTSEEIQEKAGEDLMNIFIPTSPVPASGMLILVPKKDVMFVDISLEDAFKLIVSGGIMIPEKKNNQGLISEEIQSKERKKTD